MQPVLQSGNFKFLLSSPFFLQRFWDGLNKFWLVSSSNEHQSDPFQKPCRKEEEKSREGVGCQFTFPIFLLTGELTLLGPTLGSCPRNYRILNREIRFIALDPPVAWVGAPPHTHWLSAVAVPDTYELQITKFKMARLSWKSTRLTFTLPPIKSGGSSSVSKATLTEAKGRLAICCISRISC